ncbi:hypothetical protein U1Q18_000435, partial [Sarracenia purpurea var. burkii]
KEEREREYRARQRVRVGTEKMGQIVKRKKKGRPSKADLARRGTDGIRKATAARERDVRRSLRRRNVRYNFDFDDFVDEDDDADERRREKKLKLLLKLQSKEGGAESVPSQTRRVTHASDASASSSDDGDGDKPLKKRKIDGDGELDGDVDDDDEANDVDDDNEEVRLGQAGLKGADSVPGTPSDPPLVFPLPDKKSLELILDKLQKKDIYGVFAEPVDPEELPDYHDVIEHPMDFSTVRKKLASESYSTLEQFESDVFLICTNAMQYNAPDTIYHKQAHSMQELAKKKLQRLRDAECSEKELNSEQITRTNSLAKKQIKKPMGRTAQEPVGSDFSSGATLATTGDFQSGLNGIQAGVFERLSNVDGPVEGNTSTIENNLEKVEDVLSGKGILSRLGKKPYVHDENRRATYNNSNQPVSRSESLFTTFDSEIKLLVAVGLHADHSYARSLARFAATLGPIAWKFASERIEQSLPPGFKFGRGWVGDYEPLPTPVLMLDNCAPKEPALPTNLQCASDVRKEDKTSKSPVSAQEHPAIVPTSKGKPSLFSASVTKTTESPNFEGKQPFFCSEGSSGSTTVSANYKQQSPRFRNIEQEKKSMKRVELNCPPPTVNHNTCDFVAEKQQIPNGVPASRSMETVSRNTNGLHSESLKQPENNGSSNSFDRNRMVTSSTDGKPNQMVMAATYLSHGQEQQGLSDPVQMMRMLAENNVQKHQKSLNHSSVNTLVASSVPSPRSENSSNAAAAAARAWMSVGSLVGSKTVAADNTSTHKNQISTNSLYNPTREQIQHQGLQFRGDLPFLQTGFQPAKNSFPVQAFMTPPVRMPNEAQFQNRPMFFPQLVTTTDLSRFQVQSPQQGLNLPRQQPRQKQESVPPDLNIGFPSSASPARQSSGVLVDSQQPDLALQL